jgi:hypothetical protein
MKSKIVSWDCPMLVVKTKSKKAHRKQKKLRTQKPYKKKEKKK